MYSPFFFFIRVKTINPKSGHTVDQEKKKKKTRQTCILVIREQ